MSMMHHRISRGFTIVELAAVIIVISILASIVVVSYNGSQARARDVGRIDRLKKVEDSLELYYSDNRAFPLGTSLSTLATALSPYMTIATSDLNSGGYTFTYVGQAASYGLMVTLEGTDGANDGGYYANAYETGTNPAYCLSIYSGALADWVTGATSTRRCNGGN
jgi:prepilin-type N-terminal cleavage/methylation domain-containing protein